MRLSIFAMTSLLVAAGCGDDGGGSGSSGVPGSTQLAALTPAQVTAFCQWGISLPGDGDEHQCGDGLTVTVGFGSQANCEDTVGSISGCTATVSQGEACARQTIEQPCNFLPPACVPVFECDFAGAEFTCDDGEQIPADWVCDGEDDCLTGEDEADCGQ